MVHASDEKAAALADHWGKIFKAKDIDVTAAKAFLNDYAVKLNIPDSAIPTAKKIKKFLSKVKHSAPGPDGIPYACWQAAGDKGATALFLSLVAMMNGTLPPDGFNDNLGIFIPKGVQDEDTALSVNRTAECTRPLGLKNTDNKSISAAVNNAIAWEVSDWADDDQNGFVVGRQGVNNIVTLDAKARCADMRARPHRQTPNRQTPCTNLL